MRAFEAAARHLSFRRAAAELHVTPSAISHQVRALERELGSELFVRERGHIVLTSAGASYLPHVAIAFGRLAGATSSIFEPRPLTVDAAPAFAMRVLAPRLGALTGELALLRLYSSLSLADVERGDIDAAIRHGRGTWPGLEATKLCDDEIFPVVAAAYPHRASLQSAEDVVAHRVLHVERLAHDWRAWFAAAGAPSMAIPAGPHFDGTHVALAAATGGAGVAMARAVLVADDLATGRLVAPFAARATLATGYYLVASPARRGDTRLAAFGAWVRAAVADVLGQGREKLAGR